MFIPVWQRVAFDEYVHIYADFSRLGKAQASLALHSAYRKCSFLLFIPAIAFHILPPAAGNRNRETGALTSVGANGNYWSSSSYAAGNVNAGNLWFNSGNVNPLNNTNRANGLSVRCVQHLHGVVFYLFAAHRNRHLKTVFCKTRNDGGHGFRQRGE